MGPWFGFPGFEDRFEITREGVVRSKTRYVRSPQAGGQRLLRGRIMKHQIVGGYPAIYTNVDGVKKATLIHRAIATLFVQNPDSKPEVNHLDGNKTNFSVSNLEWCTHQENMRHAFDTGLAPLPVSGPGEMSPAAKLDNERVRKIRRRLAAGEKQSRLARDYGMSKGTIGCIARNETWVDIV